MPKTLKTTSILIITASLLSCSGSSESNNSEPQADNNSTDTTLFVDQDSVKQEIPEGWIQINFDGLTVQMEEADMSWEGEESDGDYTFTRNDTAWFYLYPGDWMFDNELKIFDSKFDQIQLYTREVVNVGVDSERMIEVPFCVMGNWKSSVSQWVEIKGKDGLFVFESDVDYLTDAINYSLDDFMVAVTSNCGNEWYEEMLIYTSVDSLPTSEFTSEYQYKIVARNSESGESIEKILIFYTPTSC